MLSLILYCGLISFVVSDGNEHDIKTMVYPMTISQPISLPKDCVLKMDESEVWQIGELYKRNLTNLVDIHVSFPNASHNKDFDLHVLLVYPTASLVLEVSALQWVSRWSWTVGTRNVQLNIKWNHEDCTKKTKHLNNLALDITQDIVRMSYLVRMYKAYFSFQDSLCCPITKQYFFVTESNEESMLGSPFFVMLYFILSLSICVFACYCFKCCAIIPPLSRSFILHRIFWKENGKMVSVVRRFAITSIWLCSHFLIILNCRCSVLLIVSLFLLFVCIPCALFTLSPLCTTVLKRVKNTCLTSESFFVKCFFYVCCFVCGGYFSIVILIFWLEAAFLVNGLLLNLNYFFPYFASIFVFVFYWSSYYKTIEKKDAVSKRLIFKACREVEGITALSLPNTDPKPSNGLLVIVPEEPFPYYKDLLYFGKMCFFFVFSYGIFKFASVLKEMDFVLQAVTTMGLSVTPYIVKMISSTTCDDKQKARNEKFKLNVKHKLEELTRENPGSAITVIARTQLEITA